MDFMIGTVDSKRLRKDLLQHFRTANEQQLVALAKQEGFEMRPYIR